MPPEKSVEERLEFLSQRLDAVEMSGILPVAIGNTLQQSQSKNLPPSTTLSALEGLNGRIVTAPASEALTWIQARGEVIKQDEFIKQRRHERALEIIGISSKVVLSASAIGSGVYLAIAGFGYPAFICLGAGLYGLAPEFISFVVRRRNSGGGP